MDETERREFFRITDRLLVEFREIGHEESIALADNLHHFDAPADNTRDDSHLRPLKNPAFARNDLYSYLETIDRKLNMIIELLTKKDEQFHNEYTDVNVSGAGLRYFSQTKLEEGSYVEMRIVLPFFPNPRVAALGRVVRSKYFKLEDGKGGWETAVNFVAINEKDRDVLISYIFAKEREDLRAKHVPL